MFKLSTVFVTLHDSFIPLGTQQQLLSSYGSPAYDTMTDAIQQLEAFTAAVNGLLQLQLQKDQSTTTASALYIDLYNQLSASIEKYSYHVGDEIRAFRKWHQRHEYTLS